MKVEIHRWTKLHHTDTYLRGEGRKMEAVPHIEKQFGASRAIIILDCRVCYKVQVWASYFWLVEAAAVMFLVENSSHLYSIWLHCSSLSDICAWIPVNVDTKSHLLLTNSCSGFCCLWLITSTRNTPSQHPDENLKKKKKRKPMTFGFIYIFGKGKRGIIFKNWLYVISLILWSQERTFLLFCDYHQFSAIGMQALFSHRVCCSCWFLAKSIFFFFFSQHPSLPTVTFFFFFLIDISFFIYFEWFYFPF